MGKEQKIEVIIDTSGVEKGLTNLEQVSREIFEGMQTSMESAADSIRTLSDSMGGAVGSATTWQEQAKGLNGTLTAFAENGKTAVERLISLAGNLTETGGAAAGAVPGMSAFGAGVNSALGVVSLIATGINLVITLFEAVGDAGNESMKRMNQTTDALKESANTLTEEAAKSSAAYAETLGGIVAQSGAARTLVSDFYALKEETGGVGGAQYRLQEITSRLVELFPELSAYVNQNTKILEANQGQVEALTDSAQNMSILQAMQERELTLNDELKQAYAERSAAVAQVGVNNQNLTQTYRQVGEAAQEGGLLFSGFTLALVEASVETGGTIQNNYDLAKSVQEMQEKIEAAKQAEEAQAQAVKMTATQMLNIYQEKMAGHREMSDTEIDNMKELLAAGGEFTGKMADDYERMAEREIQALETRRAQEENDALAAEVRQQDYIDKLKTGEEQVNEALAERLEKRRQAGFELNDVEQAQLDAWNTMEQEALDRYKQIQDERVASASAMNEKINLSNQTSLLAAAENIEANTAITEQYTDDLDFLYGKIPEALRTRLEEAGTDQARLVAEMRDDMETGSGEVANRFISAYSAALAAGQPEAEAAAHAMGEAGGRGMGASDALLNATEEQLNESMEKMRSIIMDDGNFTYLGMGIFNRLAMGMRSVKDNLYSTAEGIIEGLKDRMRVNGTVSVSGSGSTANIKVNWYDKGGLFNSPQIIGIAERRPEFVGAADDLESFISKAVNSSIVRLDPALIQDVGTVGGGDTYGGDTIHFNPQVVVNAQKLTDAELKRVTDYVSREFARVITTRKVGRIR